MAIPISPPPLLQYKLRLTSGIILVTVTVVLRDHLWNKTWQPNGNKTKLERKRKRLGKK
jgi:glucose-6-phosphate-specific signal transduction histidine kinase